MAMENRWSSKQSDGMGDGGGPRPQQAGTERQRRNSRACNAQESEWWKSVRDQQGPGPLPEFMGRAEIEKGERGGGKTRRSGESSKSGEPDMSGRSPKERFRQRGARQTASSQNWATRRGLSCRSCVIRTGTKGQGQTSRRKVNMDVSGFRF